MKRAVRWCIPEPSCDTIQVWFDANDPNLWRADDSNYTTYLMGAHGLEMLADNGIFPRYGEDKEMMTVLQAMANQEGFGVPRAIPTLANNPLDLIYCDESIHFGAIGQHLHADGTPSGFAQFSSVDDPHTGGWQAGRRWLSVPAHFAYNDKLYANEPVPGRKLVGGYMGAQIAEIINRFCPPSQKGNNVPAYVHAVCQNSGVTPQTILTAANLG